MTDQNKETVTTPLSPEAKPEVKSADSKSAQMYPDMKDKAAADPAKAAADTAKAATEPAKADAAPAADTEPAAETKTDAPADEKPADSPESDSGEKQEAKAIELIRAADSPLDEDQFKELVAFVNEQKLTKEQAEKVLAREQEVMKRSKDIEAARIASELPGGKNWEARVDQLTRQCLVDPVIGGTPENFKESAELAKRGLKEFCGDDAPAWEKALHETGLGSSPLVIRHFRKLGKLAAEGRLKIGGQPSGQRQGPKWAQLYPKMAAEQQT